MRRIKSFPPVLANSTLIPVKSNKQLPPEVIAKILLKLYEPPYCLPQFRQVLHKTLAACRLVCRQWKGIVGPGRGRFYILAYDQVWLTPSLSWYVLQHTPPLVTNGGEPNQEDNPGWLPGSYTAALSRLHPKFLPDLVPNMIPWILRGNHEWKEEKGSVIRNTLAACCLVSHEWNRIFTPLLYKDIFLGRTKSLLTRSLLYRTFRHTRPAHTALVKTMTIEPAEDGSTANSLSICFSFNFPSLHKLIIDLSKIDVATLHSNFAQNLRSLSRCCAIEIGRNYGDEISTQWQSLHLWINFIRRSSVIPCALDTGHAYASGGYYISFMFENRPMHHQDNIFYSRTRFYVGKQEASVAGAVKPSNIELFKQHLTQTGGGLKGLYLTPYKPSSFPGKCCPFFTIPVVFTSFTQK